MARLLGFLFLLLLSPFFEEPQSATVTARLAVPASSGFAPLNPVSLPAGDLWDYLGPFPNSCEIRDADIYQGQFYAIARIGASPCGLWRSPDGAAWTLVDASIPDGPVRTTPTGDLLVSGKLLRNGVWLPVTGSPGVRMAARGSALFAPGPVNNVLRSDDGGLTWVTVLPDLGCPVFFVSYHPGEASLYAGSECGIVRRSVDGASWPMIDDGSQQLRNGFVAVPIPLGVLVGSRDFAKRWSGGPWALVGLPNWNQNYRAGLRAADGSLILTQEFAVWRSTDESATWAEIGQNRGLPQGTQGVPSYFRVLEDAQGRLVLVGARSQSGLYRSKISFRPGN